MESEKVNFKLSSSPLDKSFKDFNSNLVNVESKFSTDCEEHPDEGDECTLRSDHENSNFVTSHLFFLHLQNIGSLYKSRIFETIVNSV